MRLMSLRIVLLPAPLRQRAPPFHRSHRKRHIVQDALSAAGERDVRELHRGFVPTLVVRSAIADRPSDAGTARLYLSGTSLPLTATDSACGRARREAAERERAGGAPER